MITFIFEVQKDNPTLHASKDYSKTTYISFCHSDVTTLIIAVQEDNLNELIDNSIWTERRSYGFGSLVLSNKWHSSKYQKGFFLIYSYDQQKWDTNTLNFMFLFHFRFSIFSTILTFWIIPKEKRFDSWIWIVWLLAFWCELSTVFPHWLHPSNWFHFVSWSKNTQMVIQRNSSILCSVILNNHLSFLTVHLIITGGDYITITMKERSVQHQTKKTLILLIFMMEFLLHLTETIRNVWFWLKKWNSNKLKYVKLGTAWNHP